MPEPQRKPFWKRKRWIAAAALWLVIAYPMSLGPMNYADARGWVPRSLYGVLNAFYSPLDEFIMHDLPGSTSLSAYSMWAYLAGTASMTK